MNQSFLCKVLLMMVAITKVYHHLFRGNLNGGVLRPILAFQRSTSHSVWGKQRARAALVIATSPSTTPTPTTTTTTTAVENRWRTLLRVTAATSSRSASQTKNDTTTIVLTTQELVERRLAVAREKREAREQSLEQRRERNLSIKRMLHTDTKQQQQQKPSQYVSADSEQQAPPLLYAVKVSVCDELRHELKLSGREKRGRVFLTPQSDAMTSIDALQFELLQFFRALRKNTFRLVAGYPQFLTASQKYQDEHNKTIVIGGEYTSVPETTASEQEEKDGSRMDWWPLETDEDVQATFRRAQEFYYTTCDEECQSILQRPTILLHVQRDPNAPPRPPPPAYLQTLPPNPQESTPTITMLSFYAFPPAPGIEDAEAFSNKLRKVWKPFQARGRVYVATEGVNAQMSVPTNVLPNFMECCRSLEYLGEYMENGINVDPIPIDRQDFEADPPFSKLHIRVRQQVVADGCLPPLNWQEAGYDMPPLEWHDKLKEAKALRERKNDDENYDDDDNNRKAIPLILDCRNTYETDVGRFEGAEPLNTENFRDSWDVLKERLKDVPKDAPIMTYCTGGIRCVKVGAYLTQELGFRNVSRLAGGIIAYDRTLQEFTEPREEGQQPQQQQLQEFEETKATTQSTQKSNIIVEKEPSMFKGTNFVFDGRLGRPITEDALGVCITCGAETSLVNNCQNNNCHKRMVQCESCRTSFHGTCSDACRNRILNTRTTNSNSGTSSIGNGVMGPLRSTLTNKNEAFSDVSMDHDKMQPVKRDFATIYDYSSGHSSPRASVYREIEFNTQALIPTGSHMVSGETQGRLLTQLASLTREGRILELGTFTGYATACFVEGAANVATLAADPNAGGSRLKGPYVLTMERDARAFEVATSHLSILAEHGFSECAAERLCTLRSSSSEASPPSLYSLKADSPPSDMCSFKFDNAQVTCEAAKVSDALALMEEMAAGRGCFSDIAPFDLVFVDADKTRLLEYVDACLSSDRLLKKGGTIVVDNVLWKGLVLDAAGRRTQETEDEDDEALPASERSELKRNRRARKLANKMHRFNAGIVQDDRAEVLILPLRDGLSLIRKR